MNWVVKFKCPEHIGQSSMNPFLFYFVGPVKPQEIVKISTIRLGNMIHVGIIVHMYICSEAHGFSQAICDAVRKELQIT